MLHYPGLYILTILPAADRVYFYPFSICIKFPTVITLKKVDIFICIVFSCSILPLLFPFQQIN